MQRFDLHKKNRRLPLSLCPFLFSSFSTLSSSTHQLLQTELLSFFLIHTSVLLHLYLTVCLGLIFMPSSSLSPRCLFSGLFSSHSSSSSSGSCATLRGKKCVEHPTISLHTLINRSITDTECWKSICC